MNKKEQREYIPPEWFVNVRRKQVFAGLRREGWEGRKGGKHFVFRKQGHGQIIFPYGGKSPPNRITAQLFVQAGVSRDEAARILGRNKKRRP